MKEYFTGLAFVTLNSEQGNNNKKTIFFSRKNEYFTL